MDLFHNHVIILAIIYDNHGPETGLYIRYIGGFDKNWLFKNAAELWNF